MRRTGFILISILLFSFNSLKANQVTDSLERLIGTSSGIEKAKILSDLCWEYRFISADTAIIYGNRALELSQELQYDKGVAQAYNDLGIIFIDQGKFRSATDYFNRSMAIRQELNDSAGMASLFNKLGIIYQKQGDLKKALENQIGALKIYEAMEQDRWIGYCLNNIAIIHQNLDNLDKSLEYHQDALVYRKKTGDEYGEAGSYGNIANVYLKQKDTLKALNYYEKALTTFRKLDNKEGMSVILSNMGNIYLAKKDFSNAFTLLNESLVLREKLGDQKGIASSLVKIGELLTLQGKYERASEVLFRALRIARQIRVYEEELAAYLVISKMYALQFELDSAFHYTQHYIALKDSVYEARLKQQIFDVQAKYETEKIERENELLESKVDLSESRLAQRKTEIWLLISVIISITGASVTLIYRRRQKQKEALNAATIRHNEEQLKAVLDAQESERRRIARELHDGIGQTLAGIKLNWEAVSPSMKTHKKFENLTHLAGMIDNVAGEVRTMSHQMMPKELEQFGLVVALENLVNQQLGAAGIRMQFEHFGTKGRLPEKIELAFFRITQELITNAVKHAKPKTITIQLMQRKDNYILRVSDDGIGIENSNHKERGIGLMNIESRVKSIEGTLTIESEKNEGSTFTIRVPV